MVQNHYRCRCLPLPYFSHCYDECDTSSSRRLHKQSVSNIAEYCCNIAKRVSCKEFGKKLAQDYPQDCCCKNLVKKNACSCKATSNILRKKVAQESCSWKAGRTDYLRGPFSVRGPPGWEVRGSLVSALCAGRRLA